MKLETPRDFFDFFLIYLKALNILSGRNDVEDHHLFPYLYAYSGLRRELFYFLKTQQMLFV